MRFVKIVVFLLVVAVILGGIFVWTLPADVAVRYGARFLGPAVLTGVRGTAWEGHADGVSVFGRDLGELDWHAQKAPLLHGELITDLRIKGADVDAAGVLQRSSDGAIVLHDLRFRVPAELLAPALDLATLKLLGTISGVLTQASIVGASLRDASGNARWSEAGVSGQAEARFSDMLAEFASQPDGSIAGSLHDDGKGNLAVDGSFSVRLDAFDALAVLRARNNDAQVADTLRYLGEPQADGSSRLVVHGQMLKVF
jgi:general secretion pathway protein N